MRYNPKSIKSGNNFVVVLLRQPPIIVIPQCSAKTCAFDCGLRDFVEPGTLIPNPYKTPIHLKLKTKHLKLNFKS